ncbi:MAG: hypothetical protein AB7K09_20665 [Planctomycetota bacterium]
MTELFDKAGTVYSEFDAAALRQHGRAVRIPDRAVGVAIPQSRGSERSERSEPRLMASGESLKTADHTLRLFCADQLVLDVPGFEVPSRDGFACRVKARVVLSLDVREREALDDFARVVARSRTALTLDDLAAHLQPDVELGMKKFAATKDAAELHEEDVLAEALPFIQSSLRKALLSAGLIWHGVDKLCVASPELEGLRRQAAGARKQEVVARQRQRMRELWEKDRRNEALNRHEFDEFMKALEHEGLVKEQQRKAEALVAQQQYDEAWLEYERQQHDLKKSMDAMEVSRLLHVDRLKFEERLAQAKRAHETLVGASLEFFISTMDDEKEKARLYRQLMAKDMTPEQIEKLAGTDRDIEQMLEKVLVRIEDALARGADSGHFRPYVDTPKTRTHRVLLVVGKTILAYDPNDYRTVERPNEVHDVSAMHLGSLRSVRVDKWGSESVILAGARQGCYVINPNEAGNRKGAIREHAFFTESVHKGGTNSALIVGDRIYAAHSEQGLCWWPLANPDHLSTPVYRELTAHHETTRGVSHYRNSSGNGQVMFTTGGLLCAFDPANPGDAPAQVWRGGGREVTSAVLINDSIYAGNREGQLLQWSASDEEQAPHVVLTEPHAIYMLKLAQLNGLPHLVFGSKAFGVTARSIRELGLSTRFEADAPIRWVDASSDFVFGVSADQRSLFIWNTADPRHPIRKITPGDRIQDVAIWLAD